jgi:uncharacterized protein (TIGR02246 family)
MDNATTATQDSDLAAIRQVVATVEHAMEHELVDEFVGLYRQDAVATTAHGKVLVGREAIAEFTRTVLPGSAGEFAATYEVAHVLFARPDVAIVKVRQHYPGSAEDAESHGTPTYVMTKDDGRWRLAATQNTVIVEP